MLHSAPSCAAWRKLSGLPPGAAGPPDCEAPMNAIELVFSSEQPMELPIAYHALVQGLLYSVWRETRPFLHDAGFSNGGRGLRLFTFGPLRGRYQVAGRRIRFAAPLRLEVRSPVSGLLEDLCRALPERRDLALGG
ncbi:MAG: hypothetical protein IK027_05510, partial [Deltaproteobacteria bacterium]|nr:hypothetical protein [Deltaproteobacteria bacterium]